MPSSSGRPVLGAYPPWRGVPGQVDVDLPSQSVLLRTDLGGTAFTVEMDHLGFAVPASGLPIGFPQGIPAQLLTVVVVNGAVPIVLVPPNPILDWGAVGSAVIALDSGERVTSTMPGDPSDYTWTFVFQGLIPTVVVELSRSRSAFPPP